MPLYLRLSVRISTYLNRICLGLVLAMVLMVMSQAAFGQTSITLTGATPNPSQLGQSVTISGTVAPASSWGTVVFYDGTTYLGVGTRSGGNISFTTSLLPAGTRKLRAYSTRFGTGYTSNVLTHTVNAVAANGFAAPVNYMVGTGPSSVKLGDLTANTNSIADLLVANAGSNNVSRLAGVGNGTFGIATPYVVTNTPKAIALGDFNKDGSLDFITADFGLNVVTIRTGTGTNAFTTGTYTRSTDPGPVDVAVADFDGDGNLDVVTANVTAGTVTVRLGNGDGTLNNHTEYAVGGNPLSVRVADLNNDGRPDIIVANNSSNNVSVLLRTAGGSFSAAVNYPVNLAPAGLEIADFNGDGNADVVTANSTSGTVSVLLGVGNGTLLPAVDYAAGWSPVYVAVGDVNGDGKLDIVLASSIGNDVAILNGNGDGTFQDPKRFATGGSTPSSVAIGDFNGDGRTDLAVTNSATNNVSILLGAVVADLTITKTHVGPFHQGQTGAQYTITVTNSGAGATSGTVTVIDTLPARMTATSMSGTGWTCNTGTVTCTRSNALAAGASYPAITLTVDVGDDAPAGVMNTATVSGGGETDTSNDTAHDNTDIIPNNDLAITKTHSGSFYAGQVGATYTITVTNLGPSAMLNSVTVTDTLPAGLTATAIGGPGWSCTLATLACTRNDIIPAGSTYPAITLTVNVSPTAPAQVTNTVSVTSEGDFNPLNSTAQDVTDIGTVADMFVQKYHLPIGSSFIKGQQGAQYTFDVYNHGGGPSVGTVTVTDPLPPELTFNSVLGTGWSCTTPAVGANGTVTCSRSDALAPGHAYPGIILAVNVLPTASDFVNIATISGGGETNTSDDTTNDPTTVISAPTNTTANSQVNTYGATVLTAHVSLAVGNVLGTPTGTVTFTEFGVPLGTAPVNGTGDATLNAFTLSAGMHHVVATYSGDSQFNLSTSATWDFTVAAAPLTITANSFHKTYGTTYTLTGAEFTTSGLVNGDTVTSVTLASAGFASTAKVVAPGPTYPIVPSAAVFNQGLGNYNINYVDGTLTIDPKPATITADSIHKPYGTTYAPNTSEFSAAGLVNGDTIAGVTLTSAGFAATAQVGAPGPVYTIVPSGAFGAAAGNYNFTYNNGSLTVDPKPLTLTANDASRTYGATNPTFTVAGSGFANSDTVASLSGTLACTTTAVATSPVSPPKYPITCSGLSSPNYDPITWLPGALTITQATPVVTATCLVATFDGAPHGCTAAATGVGGAAVSGTMVITYNALGTAPTNAGTYSVLVTFTSSDPNYTGGVGNGSLTINKANPTLSLSCPTVTYDGGVHACTGSATGVGAATVGGSWVITYNGSTSAPSAVGTYAVAGTFTSTDDNYNGGTANGQLVIDPVPTTTTLSAPAVTYPSAATVTVTVSAGGIPHVNVGRTEAAPGPGLPSGTVTLVVDSAAPMSATLASGVATFTVPGLNAGTHTLTATYPVQGNFAGSSDTGTLVVNPAVTTTTVTSSLNPSYVGNAVTFTATVASAGGTPAGSVTFLEGTTSLGTGTLNTSGVATLTTSSLTAATHSITVSYGGSTNFSASVSAVLSQVVKPPQVVINGTSNSIVVTAGNSGSATMTISSLGTLTNAATFTCSGLPLASTCNFSPSTIGPTLPGSVTVTISTTGLKITGENRPLHGWGITLAMMLPAMLILPAVLRRRSRLAIILGLIAIAILLIGFTGCGGLSKVDGISNATTSTAPGTYVVTVTGASAGATSGTMNINLTVTP